MNAASSEYAPSSLKYGTACVIPYIPNHTIPYWTLRTIPYASPPHKKACTSPPYFADRVPAALLPVFSFPAFLLLVVSLSFFSSSLQLQLLFFFSLSHNISRLHSLSLSPIFYIFYSLFILLVYISSSPFFLPNSPPLESIYLYRISTSQHLQHFPYPPNFSPSALPNFSSSSLLISSCGALNSVSSVPLIHITFHSQRELVKISSISHKAKKRKTKRKRLNLLARKFAGVFAKFSALNRSRGVTQLAASSCRHAPEISNQSEIPPGSRRVGLSHPPKTAPTIAFAGEEKAAAGRPRVWRNIRVRAKEAGSKKAEALREMIPGRSRNTFSPWNLTPESSPRHTPIPSDLDSDDERDMMENWHTSRPISLALSRPTLDEVLSNQAPPPYTLTAFMAYLSQNHCLETLEFTMDSKRYSDNYMSVARQTNEIPIMSDTPQAANLCMLWQRLLAAYIVPGAPREINLPSTVRDALLRHANARRPPHPETLDSAVKRMRDLMDESIFIPFLNSRTVQPPPPQPRRSEGLSFEETNVNRRISMRQRLSPQSSFVSPRSTTSGYFSYNPTTTTNTSHGPSYAPSRSNTTRHSPHGYNSGDSITGSLTDDTGSIPSSPGSREPMTPPTTPPSSDLHSPKHRSENTWKKMGMKLGFKKRPGGSGGGSSSGGGGATSGPTSRASDDR